MRAKYNPRLPFFYTTIGLGCLLHSLVWAQPQLTTQPRDQFFGPGAPATFSVSPGGTGPFAYQWLFDGSAMAGTTNQVLSLGTPQPSQWGYYSVIVSDSSGSVTSQVAELKVFVTSPHLLSGIQGRANGSVDLTFAGETTSSLALYYSLFPLETSSNLVDWTPLAMLQRANTTLDPLHFVDDGAADSSPRFYRTPGSQLPTPAPQPTGPYAVGTFSVLVTNTLRPNDRFMATFWYPAVAQAGVLPVKYMDRQVAVNYYGGLAFSAAAFFSHALPNASIATNLAPYPVLLYSPGYSGHRRENTDKTEELASWGYVVIGLDTRNTVVSVLPNGSVLHGQDTANSVAGRAADVEAHLQDARALLDQLETLNADPRLGGRLDLQRIGMFGFSLGGATAAQLCLRDPRCKAGAGFDGTYWGGTNLLTQPLPVPWLFFRSDDTPDPAWPPGASALIGQDDRPEVYNLQASNAYFVRLVSTVHASFGAYDLFYDSPSFLTMFGLPMSGRALPPARVSEIVRAYLLSFFNKFLKGEDNHLLDARAPAYPEVMQFLSKSSSSGEPEYPCAELVQGSDGNLYGTSQYGGTNAAGTVFRLTPEGALTTLASFTGTNGSHPVAAVTQASDGNFYGTTEYGGANGNYGTVFQMTPAGTLTTLVSFNGTNGSYPAARLAQGSDGSFYGTTAGGGAGDYGTVFRVTSTGALTTLVSFKNTDGAGPLAALVEGADGSFYGTTSRGGDLSVNSGGGLGTVFKITPAGVLTTLVRFNGDNGGGPAGTLVLGSDANFYGTTAYGGSGLNGGYGYGTVFKMTPAGALTRLVIFGGANGSYGIGPLVQGSDASFYGTTYGGGAGIGGTVFKMTSLAAQTTLVSFNGDNGYRLPAGLLQATDGSFYGITQFGGPNGAGTVFQLSLAGTLKTLIAFGAHSNHP